MPRDEEPGTAHLNRRELVAGCLAAGVLAAARQWSGPPPLAAESSPGAARTPAAVDQGELLGMLPFVGEGSWRNDGPQESLERRFGSGLGGRKIFDLSTLDRQSLAVPADRFFIRTFKPDGLEDARRWKIDLVGLVRRPVTVRIQELQRRARPRGTHLVECSGNSAEHSFGLLSAARWSGVPVVAVLDRAHPLRRAAAVEVVGFDLHPATAISSTPGASWIFTREQLAATKAFFATELDGRPLPADHGVPVRLIVPGWYGCTSIKWVRSIRWVGPDALASSQMREFAARTHQQGVPERALDFAPAAIDPAAMPVWVEKWQTARGLELRVLGILWGGDRPVKRLAVRCGAQGPWLPVDHLEPGSPATWRLWRYVWRTPTPGQVEIRLRVDEPRVRTRRLDTGYYARTVDVGEV